LAQLDALSLAARERGSRLADLDIAQADALERGELVADDRHGGEEFDAFVDRHVEHVGDRLALELHFERLPVVALALADVAGDINVGQEVHFDLEDAIALTFFAAATLDVEGET